MGIRTLTWQSKLKRKEAMPQLEQEVTLSQSREIANVCYFAEIYYYGQSAKLCNGVFAFTGQAGIGMALAWLDLYVQRGSSGLANGQPSSQLPGAERILIRPISMHSSWPSFRRPR